MKPLQPKQTFFCTLRVLPKKDFPWISLTQREERKGDNCKKGLLKNKIKLFSSLFFSVKEG